MSRLRWHGWKTGLDRKFENVLFEVDKVADNLHGTANEVPSFAYLFFFIMEPNHNAISSFFRIRSA